MAFVYIIKCADGSYYTGWAKELGARIAAHNSGTGARYTRSRQPVTLMYSEEYEDANMARKREFAIKRLSRRQKEQLIQKKQKEEKESGTMFVRDASKQSIPVVAGVRRKTLAFGEKGLMSKFYLEKGGTLPKHQHPHEQIGYLVSGEIILHIGAEAANLKPGDSWAVPGGTEHWAEVVETAEAIEVFVPVREDYLDTVSG